MELSFGDQFGEHDGTNYPVGTGIALAVSVDLLLKDANWSRLTKEKVEEGIKKLEERLTMQTVDESPPAQDLKFS